MCHHIIPLDKFVGYVSVSFTKLRNAAKAPPPLSNSETVLSLPIHESMKRQIQFKQEVKVLELCLVKNTSNGVSKF